MHLTPLKHDPLEALIVSVVLLFSSITHVSGTGQFPNHISDTAPVWTHHSSAWRLSQFNPFPITSLFWSPVSSSSMACSLLLTVQTVQKLSKIAHRYSGLLHTRNVFNLALLRAWQCLHWAAHDFTSKWLSCCFISSRPPGLLWRHLPTF